jgi:hypothetical protein
MVLTVSSALSPVTGLCCHRHRRDAKHRRQLDASVGASGPHDFAVRASAARLAPLPRPPHPAPNVRDDAYAPLIEAGRGELVEMICPTAKAKYFCKEGWTAISQNNPSGKSPREPTRRRASNIAALTPRSRSGYVNDGRREKITDSAIINGINGEYGSP